MLSLVSLVVVLLIRVHSSPCESKKICQSTSECVDSCLDCEGYETNGPDNVCTVPWWRTFFLGQEELRVNKNLTQESGCPPITFDDGSFACQAGAYISISRSVDFNSLPPNIGTVRFHGQECRQDFTNLPHTVLQLEIELESCSGCPNCSSVFDLDQLPSFLTKLKVRFNEVALPSTLPTQTIEHFEVHSSSGAALELQPHFLRHTYPNLKRFSLKGFTVRNSQLDFSQFRNAPALVHLELSHAAHSAAVVQVVQLWPSLPSTLLVLMLKGVGQVPVIAGDLPNNLVRLELVEGHFSGTVDWSALPLTVEHLDFSHNNFVGEITAVHLPPNLKKLVLSHNQFNGTLPDLSLLPTLQSLDVSDNQLTGSLDLTALPPTLRWAYFEDNVLSGTLNLTLLPPQLEWVNFGNNQLEGEVQLTGLPDGLRLLDLSANGFEGSLDLTGLPQTLGWLHFDDNEFSGPLLLTTDLPGSLLWLTLHGNPFEDNVVIDLSVLPTTLANFKMTAGCYAGHHHAEHDFTLPNSCDSTTSVGHREDTPPTTTTTFSPTETLTATVTTNHTYTPTITHAVTTPSNTVSTTTTISPTPNQTTTLSPTESGSSTASPTVTVTTTRSRTTTATVEEKEVTMSKVQLKGTVHSPVPTLPCDIQEEIIEHFQNISTTELSHDDISELLVVVAGCLEGTQVERLVHTILVELRLVTAKAARVVEAMKEHATESNSLNRYLEEIAICVDVSVIVQPPSSGGDPPSILPVEKEPATSNPATDDTQGKFTWILVVVGVLVGTMMMIIAIIVLVCVIIRRKTPEPCPVAVHPEVSEVYPEVYPEAVRMLEDLQHQQDHPLSSFSLSSSSNAPRPGSSLSEYPPAYELSEQDSAALEPDHIRNGLQDYDSEEEHMVWCRPRTLRT